MEKKLLIYKLMLPVQETNATEEKKKKKRGLVNTMPNFSTKKIYITRSSKGSNYK